MIRLSFIRLVFVCLSSSRFFAEVHGQWCYWPGGEEKALQQYPCDAYAVTTLCCPLGWTCFSNNLCVVTDETAVANAFPIGTASRGTCTNPLWDDTYCGDFCLDGTGSSNNGSLQTCGGGNFCCESSVASGSCDCESGTGTFSVSSGQAVTVIGAAGLSSTSTSSPTSTSSSSSQTMTSTSSSSSKSTSSTSITSKSIWVSSTIQSTSSRTPTSHTSSSTASAVAATSTHAAVSLIHKPGVQAGIAIAAIAVAFLIIAFLVWFFWHRRRNRSTVHIAAMADTDSDIYHPEPASALPGPILRPVPRPTPDPYEFRPVSPVSESGARDSEVWSGGFSGGHAGRTTDERIRPVVDPYRIPYEGT